MNAQQINESAKHMAQLLLASNMDLSDLEAAILAQMEKNMALNDKYATEQAFANEYNAKVLETI